MTQDSHEDDGPIDEAATAKAAAIAAARSLDGILDQKDIDDEIKAQARGLRATLRKKWADLKSATKSDGDDKAPGTSQEKAHATEAAVLDDWSQIALNEAQDAPGRFNVRIIRPGWGASGYYSAATLEAAAKDRVFGKGLKMYWNHPTASEARERPERDLRDLAGVLEGDARWDPDGKDGPGLYAPISTVTHYRDTVKELAPYIGVSIRGDGRGRVGEADGKKGRIIEAITAAKSVDFVTAPGAGGKVLELFEAARAHHTMEDEGMDLEEARREIDAEKAKNTKLAASLKEAQEERDRALVAVAAIEARSLVQEQLSSVKLPDATKARIIESIARQVPLDDEGEVDRKAVKKAVEEAAKEESAYLAKVLGKGRIEGMGDSGDGDTGDGPDRSPAALKESQEALSAAFARLGLGEKEVVHAINGR